jgi:hypothetical protein
MVGSRTGNLSRWSSVTANPSNIFFVGFLFLAAGYCFSTVSVARAREPTPTQRIQEGLPKRKTIKTAERKQLINAICRAVSRHRSAAPGIAAAGVGTRPELASEITATVLRCAGKIDCDFVAKIVGAAGQPNKVSRDAVADAALARAPDCAEAIDRALRPASKEPSPTPVKAENATPAGAKPNPDEGFDPFEPLRLVCDAGNQRALRASEVEEFLRTHPGAILGECPATPSPSPTATLAPAILLPPPEPNPTPAPTVGAVIGGDSGL